MRRKRRPGETRPGGLRNVSYAGALRLSLVVLLVLSLGGMLLVVLHHEFGGDEYIFLSNIYRYVDGRSLQLLQTVDVHLFTWLPHIGGNEFTQITAARLLYVVVWLCSLALLYRLGRKLVDPLAALSGVVLFALFSYSILTAASFRIDGLLLPILLAIALLLLDPTTLRVAASAALSAVATALTVKAVLWAPAFIGVLMSDFGGARNGCAPSPRA